MFVELFGAHHFDIAQWGLGMDESGPLEIIPTADWQSARNGVRLRYENGIEVVHVSGNGIMFVGKDGVVQVDRGRIKVTIGGRTIEKGDMTLGDQLDGVEKELLLGPKAQIYRSADHLDDWLDAIRSRKNSICDVETGARTTTACHLVNLAYYHGQPMKWNPSREKFGAGIGDPRWLNVAHRAP